MQKNGTLIHEVTLKILQTCLFKHTVLINESVQDSKLYISLHRMET